LNLWPPPSGRASSFNYLVDACRNGKLVRHLVRQIFLDLTFFRRQRQSAAGVGSSSLFTGVAADCAFEIKTPTRLAKQFGASIYASAREFGRTHHRACVVYVLEPIELVDGCRARRRPTHRTVGAVCQAVRPSIRERDHARSSVGARAAGSAQGDAAHLGVTHDLNGVQHEYVVEAFDTTYNVLILAYMIRALTRFRSDFADWLCDYSCGSR